MKGVISLIKYKQKSIKKLIFLVLGLILFTGLLYGCVGTGDSNKESKEVVEINLGHALSEGTKASQLINEFTDVVAEKTEGRVEINDFPNSKLGSETEMLEQLKIGSLESAAIMVGSMQSIDMKMAIEDLPYMWKSREYAREAYDGEFGEYLADLMSENGLKEIGYIEWGFRHITNNVRPIVNPEDMEGISIRVAETKLRVDAFEEIGALPTIMAFSDLYGALQQGVVDAQENPLTNIVAANFNEVQDYLSLTEHFYNTVMVVISNDVWDKISSEDQEVILAEMNKVSKEVRLNNEKSESDYIKELKDGGMQVNDNVNKRAFREAMLPVYAEWEEDVFGEELMNIYREASGW